MPATPAPTGRFMRMPELRQETGLSRSTLYRLIEKGEFPRQAKLADNCAGWWSAQVDAWKTSRLEASQQN